MTGRGHRLFGVGFGVLTGLLIAPKFGMLTVSTLLAGVLPGSTAPDWLEGKIGNFRVITHRTITHTLIFWLLPLVALFPFIGHQNFAVTFIVGFFIGGLSHCIGDLGTPLGIPIWHPGKRVSINLWSGNTELIPITFLWLANTFIFLSYIK